MSNITPTKRIGYLDATRGIAALMVLVYHYSGWVYGEKMSVKVAHLLFNGSDVVSYFFVLSGFVLSFPYFQYNRPLDFGKFYVKRIYRIFPAFIVALIITVLISHRNELTGKTFRALWGAFGPDGVRFWKEVILIQGHNVYLGVGWTLSIELVMSFLIPFFVVLAFRNRKLIVWLSFVTIIATFILGYFINSFVLGVLIAAYFNEIQSEDFKKTKWYRYRYPILLLAVLLFSLRHIDRIFPIHSTILEWMNFFRIDFFMLSGIASFIFMVYLIHAQKWQQTLEHPILLFIGKISYGIYLIHWPIVTLIFIYWDAILKVFPNELSAFVFMFFVCVALTIGASSVLYHWVELPYIRKGKKRANRLKRSLIIEP